MLPPRLVRRLVFAPMIIVIAVAMVVAMPLLLLVGLIASRGRRRMLRLVWVAACWLALETVALFACLALWIAAGFGGKARTAAYTERHYALCGWFLNRLYGVAEKALHLAVEIEEPLDVGTDRPVIVLSRHAGPGDSFLIVHFLLNTYHRRPRIVMKAALQFDPGIDVMVNRLPTAFIPTGAAARERAVAEIGRLATGLGPKSALLIFPEGGNFTPRRRMRAIRLLRRRGRSVQAERARKMPNLLPPHPNGTLAALAAAPEADVVFVAHTGVDDLMSVGDVWRAIPIEQTLRARWWRVPAAEIPPPEEQERWLYDWWARIDEWISAQKGSESLKEAR